MNFHRWKFRNTSKPLRWRRGLLYVNSSAASVSKNSSNGFTLIELLVVIAIIGVLAAIVLVSLNTARIRARDSRRLEDVRNIASALELYNSRYGFYPDDDNLPVPPARWNRLALQLRSAGLLGGDVRDPSNVSPYFYDYASDPTYTVGGDCPPSTGIVSWVVSAVLEQSSNPALLADIDCAFSGAARSCVDPVFCFTGR